MRSLNQEAIAHLSVVQNPAFKVVDHHWAVELILVLMCGCGAGRAEAVK